MDVGNLVSRWYGGRLFHGEEKQSKPPDTDSEKRKAKTGIVFYTRIGRLAFLADKIKVKDEQGKTLYVLNRKSALSFFGEEKIQERLQEGGHELNYETVDMIVRDLVLEKLGLKKPETTTSSDQTQASTTGESPVVGTPATGPLGGPSQDIKEPPSPSPTPLNQEESSTSEESTSESTEIPEVIVEEEKKEAPVLADELEGPASAAMPEVVQSAGGIAPSLQPAEVKAVPQEVADACLAIYKALKDLSGFGKRNETGKPSLTTQAAEFVKDLCDNPRRLDSSNESRTGVNSTVAEILEFALKSGVPGAAHALVQLYGDNINVGQKFKEITLAQACAMRKYPPLQDLLAQYMTSWSQISYTVSQDHPALLEVFGISAPEGGVSLDAFLKHLDIEIHEGESPPHIALTCLSKNARLIEKLLTQPSINKRDVAFGWWVAKLSENQALLTVFKQYGFVAESLDPEVGKWLTSKLDVLLETPGLPEDRRIEYAFFKEKIDKINAVPELKMAEVPLEAARTVTPAGLKTIDKAQLVDARLSEVNSSKTEEIIIEGETISGLNSRSVFSKAVEQGQWKRKVPIFSKSEFVNEAFVRHLATEKRPSALGEKYRFGTHITNMEGALATFVTPMVRTTAAVDNVSHWEYAPLSDNEGREIILSMAVQPDYECGGADEVMMQITALQEEEIVGEPLPEDFIPLQNVLKKYPETRAEYDKKLQKHMIYHLLSSHTLPARSAVSDENILTIDAAQKMLEECISKEDFSPDELNGKFVRLNDRIHSLEIFLNICVHLMCNEFSVLEAGATQGYVYSIDPAQIFARQLGEGGGTFLNRLQILALKHLKAGMFPHLTGGVYFNDYADKGAIPLLKKIFPNTPVGSKKDLFAGEPARILNKIDEGLWMWADNPECVPEKALRYQGPTGNALVDHNNSDSFGWNLGTEGGLDSKDAINGQGSDASCSVEPKYLSEQEFVIV